MKFLVVSQRAYPNPNYSLKNLTGHGRIDIIFRAILAATRPLMDEKGVDIYCYLKGQEPHGWLTINPTWISNTDDEISVAAKVKENWDNLFTTGNLNQCLDEIKFDRVLILHEDGLKLESKVQSSSLIVLGAQADLTEGDLAIFENVIFYSLGSRSLLSSHAITYFRQKNLVLNT